jgi:hypothetical protein
MAALQDPDGSIQIPYLATGFNAILERDLPSGYCIEELRNAVLISNQIPLFHDRF